MDINDLMKLVNAGFTKDEILSMSGATVTPTSETMTAGVVETTEPPQVVENKVEVKTEEAIPTSVEPTPQTTTNVNFAPMMSDAQVEKLAQLLNRGQATIDLPQQKNIEDILGEHYKELFTAK